MLHGGICRAGTVVQLSFIFGPVPSASGPGHKGRVLKCSDSGYLSVLVGPYLSAGPTREQEDVEGSDSS